MSQEARTHARRLKMSLHCPVGRRSGANELEDFLHLNDVALEARDFGNRGDFAPATRLALQLHDELNGFGDLAPNRSHRHRQTCHTDHLLQARDRVAGRVGVNCRHRTFVTGVHRLQHVEGFFAAALAKDDAVGSHTERVFHQFALAYFALAFDVRWTGFHAADMWLLQLQLGGVLDCQQTLFFGNERREGVEHRGLSGAGTTGNDRGDARFNRGRQDLSHRWTQRTYVDQLRKIERFLGKLTDRNQRTIDADRPYRHVDA